MSVTDEIEESLRICEEILNDNPEFVMVKPDFDIDDIVEKKEAEVAVEVMEESVHSPEVVPIVEEMVAVQESVEANQEETVVVQESVEANQEEAVAVQENSEEEETGSVKGFLVRLASCVVIAFLVALLITKFVANHTTVEGSSMDPCLQDGDELLVEKISYLVGEPERFDVIVFEQSEDVNYVKRVIGLPGETVQIKDEKIYVNDRAVFDEHRKERMKSAGIAKDKITLGADEYFVLGDNRNASKDSRDETVGLVKKKQIRGKAWIRVLPSEKFGEIQ